MGDMQSYNLTKQTLWPQWPERRKFRLLVVEGRDASRSGDPGYCFQVGQGVGDPLTPGAVTVQLDFAKLLPGKQVIRRLVTRQDPDRGDLRQFLASEQHSDVGQLSKLLAAFSEQQHVSGKWHGGAVDGGGRLSGGEGGQEHSR